MNRSPAPICACPESLPPDRMPMNDLDLYRRGLATLLASWAEYARGARGGALRRLDGVAAGVFPHHPERAVYNNAIIDRDLGPGRRAAAVTAMEDAYAAAGVDCFAAWAHESDEGLRAELTNRGYELSETTRAMAMVLGDVPVPAIAIERLSWPTTLRHLWSDDAPDGLLAGADPTAFHAVGARLDGAIVATGIAYDHDRDCVVGNVGTLAHARRRGIGTAITARLVADAQARGCITASLQAT